MISSFKFKGFNLKKRIIQNPSHESRKQQN